MKQATLLYLAVVAGFGTLLLFGSAGSLAPAPAAGEGDSVKLATPQRVRPPRMKASYDFAGEQVPVDDYDVAERLDRELLTNTFSHSSTQHILKHRHRYFEVIEPILREEGVPEDLKYVAIAESGLRDFRSPAGAAGVWHFMKGTAREYGLEVNDEVDERYHLEKATRAAARLFKDLRASLGSWTLAAAAYNRGAAGIRRDKAEQGGETYYDLNLNAETGRYVFRIVALKDILDDPTYYGFYLQDEDRYPSFPDYSVVRVTESVPSWADFAQEHGISYRKLKYFNPWLRDSKLTVKTKEYEIRLPR